MDSSLSNTASAPPQKAGFFYGWIVVIALTVVMTIINGAYFSFGVFLKPISEEFDWTRATTSGAFSTCLWVSGLLGILTGALTDKYGPRMVIIVGALLGGLGYLLLSYTGALWHLYVGFGIMVAVNKSTCWTPLMATTSRWFTKRRVLALGIVTAGVGLGQMLIPPLAAHLIEGYDWSTAYRVIAIMIWVIPTSAAMLVRRSPQDMGLLPDGKTQGSNTAVRERQTETVEMKEWSHREAVRTLPFWLLVFIHLMHAASYLIVMAHIVARATDVGIAATSAALILTFIGGATILSRIVVGGISLKVGSRVILLSCLILMAVALFCFVWVRDLWMFCALGVLFGFGYGGSGTIGVSLVSELFGLRSVGVILGFTGFGWNTGCAIGAFLGGYIFDITGSYITAFVVGGVVALIGAMLVFFLRAPKRLSQKVA